MAKRLKIALLIESCRASRRALLRGIAAYGRAHGPWLFYHHEGPLRHAAPAELSEWDGDGIIVRTESHKLIHKIEQMGLPMVDPIGSHHREGISQIDTSHQAVARLAADHLLQRGFQHFAYCGFAGLRYSEQRRTHFVSYLAEKGYQSSVYEGLLPRARISAAEKSRPRAATMVRWIDSLAKPVGLMACNDMCAQQVLTVCGEHGIAVPDEVAVIGVDNDEVLCELCDPLLSSIDPNFRKIGYEAAALLDQMIGGRHPPEKETFIEPLGVVTRQSTDVLAIADRDVAAAIHFIREHACDGIHIKHVLQHVQLSRSTLERRFMKLLDHSPRAEIIRVQLQRVKELLIATDFPLAKIAQLAGFNYAESMCDLFKNMTGQSPGQYRKESRARG